MYSYVLKLENNNNNKNFYFLGRTNNQYFKITNHSPNEWTNLHPPISLIALIKLDIDTFNLNFDINQCPTELKLLASYIKKYSINNVRHISHPNVVYDEATYTFYRNLNYYYNNDNIDTINNNNNNLLNKFKNILFNNNNNKITNNNYYDYYEL